MVGEKKADGASALNPKSPDHKNKRHGHKEHQVRNKGSSHHTGHKHQQHPSPTVNLSPLGPGSSFKPDQEKRRGVHSRTLRGLLWPRSRDAPASSQQLPVSATTPLDGPSHKEFRSPQRGDHEGAGRSWKGVVIAVAIVAIAGAAGISLLSWRRGLRSQTAMSLTSPSVCRTPFCEKYASLLSDAVNESADACQDFYRHVCGLWEKRHSRHSTVMHEAWNAFMKLVVSRMGNGQVPQAKQGIEDKARLYLKACLKVLNESNIPNVKHILAKGGIVWPEKNRRPDFLNALFFLSRYLFMPVLLHLSFNPSADGRTTLLRWTLREDYRKKMAALLTIGKTNHIRDHLRVTYDDFSGSPNETRLEEIMEHMEVFLAFLNKLGDAPGTSVTFNNSDKFLQYAPSVSRQRWDAAFRQYVNNSIGSYSGVIVDDVAYFAAVFELHQTYGEDIMNDIVETVSVLNLVAFTSADLLMSFSWGQRDTMIKKLIENCFEYVYVIFGFAVNNQLMSHGLAHAQRHVRELGESLQSTFLSSLGDRTRNVSTRKENGSALKGKDVFDSVFELLTRSQPLEYPTAYRHYPNITDDPLENWLRFQAYYIAIPEKRDLYFIVYHPEAYVKFKDFQLMLHYLMFPFYADNAHVGVLAGGLGLRLAAAVFYRIIDEAGGAEAMKIYRQNQDCLGHEEKEVDLDIQGATAAVPVTQKLYSKMRKQAQYSKLLGSIQSFTDVQVPFVAGCYLLCGEERGPDLCNIPLMHSVDFSRAFGCSAYAKMNPTKKCSMVPQ